MTSNEKFAKIDAKVAAFKEFFESEIANEDRGDGQARNGSCTAGDTPATLRSCLDTLRQYDEEQFFADFQIELAASESNLLDLIDHFGEDTPVENLIG